MSLVRTCESKFATHTMTKMPVVEGVKFCCDKCGGWFEELWEIRRTVNKDIHLPVWPSINNMYCKNCTNEVWYYEVLGNKGETGK